MILEYTDDNFNVSTGIVVVDFWSPRCGPCVMLAPVLEATANKNPNVTFAKVNAAENHSVSNYYGISAVPTLIFFKDGALVKKLVGYQTEQALTKHIADLSR
jgi:thioredoxin 1